MKIRRKRKKKAISGTIRLVGRLLALVWSPGPPTSLWLVSLLRLRAKRKMVASQRRRKRRKNPFVKIS